MTEFSRDIWYGYILRGDLRAAAAYLAQFPEEKERQERLEALFLREEYEHYDLSPELNGVLQAYQQYYRDVFWIGLGKEASAGHLARRLGTDDLDTYEMQVLPQRFRAEGLHFLGGRTAGYYGPYVWRETEELTFEVELPGGIRTYPVRFLDGFLMKGWLDTLSQGEIGTGGWSDGDGVINCVRSAYDLDSESFRVSLLKHEAQHALDLAAGIADSGELEYRAKLVELIYTRERQLLLQFAGEADDSDPSNGHGAAAARIVRGFEEKLGCVEYESIPVETVQRIALQLFCEIN